MPEPTKGAVRLEYSIGGVRVMCLGSCDGTGANGCPICMDDAATVARRDAEWRRALESMRSPSGYSPNAHTAGFNAAIDAVLARMEAK